MIYNGIFLAAGGGGRFAHVYEYTETEFRFPGDFTWTCPDGITKVYAIIAGGGAGGSRTDDGNSGETKVVLMQVTAGVTYSGSVGAGGTSAKKSSGNGSAGGSSSNPDDPSVPSDPEPIVPEDPDPFARAGGDSSFNNVIAAGGSFLLEPEDPLPNPGLPGSNPIATLVSPYEPTYTDNLTAAGGEYNGANGVNGWVILKYGQGVE